MKHEVTFHNYHSIEDLHAGHGQKATHTKCSDTKIKYLGSCVCFSEKFCHSITLFNTR